LRALFISIFITIYATAFLIPNKVYTTVASVNGSSLNLMQKLPINGMSALVVRATPSGEYALAYIKQNSISTASIIDKEPLGGNSLAKLKPVVRVGDRVIGGHNYDKALLLAPKDRYKEIASTLGVKLIDPQIYSAYKASSASSSYRDFAKLVGIGLVIVSKGNTLEIIDAISEDIIVKESIK
jgi:hypothetical protein